MTVHLFNADSLFTVEHYKNDIIKAELSIVHDKGYVLFNESLALKKSEALLQNLTVLFNWDLTIEESTTFFSPQNKGFYSHVEEHENIDSKYLADIIEKYFLYFNKYREVALIFKENANYEEYINYEY